MDTVKIAISVGMFSIQIEGSEAFVQKSLVEYRPIIKWHHKRSAEQALSSVTTRTGHDNHVKLANLDGLSCGKRLTKLVEEGYFQQPKTSSDVLS